MTSRDCCLVTDPQANFQTTLGPPATSFRRHTAYSQSALGVLIVALGGELRRSAASKSEGPNLSSDGRPLVLGGWRCMIASVGWLTGSFEGDESRLITKMQRPIRSAGRTGERKGGAALSREDLPRTVVQGILFTKHQSSARPPHGSSARQARVWMHPEQQEEPAHGGRRRHWTERRKPRETLDELQADGGAAGAQLRPG